MIPDEIFKYRLIRELVQLELPSLIQRYHEREQPMTDQELLDEPGKPNMEAIRLLTDAAGSIQASASDPGISQECLNYRINLADKIKAFLEGLA